MSGERQESPNPNPLPNVDTRYTGTADDALDAQIEDEDDRGNVIDLQPTNRPRCGGSGSGGRKHTKPPKALRARCADCGKGQTADVAVCQDCGSDAVTITKPANRRGRKKIDPAKKKVHLPRDRVPPTLSPVCGRDRGTHAG